MDEHVFQDLMNRVRQGEQAALEQVVAWLQGAWSAWIRGKLRKAQVPERDVSNAVAEVFEEVRMRLPSQFQGNHPKVLGLYITRICLTVARAYHQGVDEVPTAPAALVVLPGKHAGPETPETAVLNHEVLYKALTQLSERYAEAWIFSVQGYPLAEIAAQLGCRVTRAKKLVDEAQRAMREWLTLLHVILDLHLDPAQPAAGQQVETWVTLWNAGYADAEGLGVMLRVDKRRLGRRSPAKVPRDARQDVRGFPRWIRCQHPQTIVATVTLGGKKLEKARVVHEV